MPIPVAIIAGAKIIAGIAAALYGTHAIGTAGTRGASRKDTDKVYSTYLNNLEKAGITNLSTKDALDHLRALNYISVDEHKEALAAYEKYEKQYADKGPDVWYTINTKSKDFQALQKMYEKLNEHSNVFANAARMTSDELKGTIKDYFDKSLGNIHDAAAPSYFDTTFDNEIKEAKPMHLMTGQEMADLHGLDYNPDTYYDLIKQGTEANVKYTDYLSRQMNEASMYEDTKNVNTYLDAIRNNKAEALASGATAGARAAQEVLANQAAITSYADKQANVANQRYDTVSQALIEDAQAKLTARDYFNSLAQSLATDAVTLYSNDSQRYAAEQAMYANIFDANEYLRQERIKANGAMEGDYASAQASINAAKQGLSDRQSELGWIYDRLLGAYGGDTLKANLEFNKITRKDTLGYSSYVDNYNTYYNQ